MVVVRRFKISKGDRPQSFTVQATKKQAHGVKCTKTTTKQPGATSHQPRIPALAPTAPTPTICSDEGNAQPDPGANKAAGGSIGKGPAVKTRVHHASWVGTPPRPRF